MKKQFANILTALRIICSIILLFLSSLSVPFFAVYVIAGITDMLDGFVARKLKTESKFGSVLDTVADISFVGVCLVKLLPKLDISLWLCIWLAVIIHIKLTSIILGFIIHKTMVAEHTPMNKITGIFLFLFLLVMPMIDLNIGVAVLCAMATLAAIQECFCVLRKAKKYD